MGLRIVEAPLRNLWRLRAQLSQAAGQRVSCTPHHWVFMKALAEGGDETHELPAFGPAVRRLDPSAPPGPFDELGDPLMR